MNNNDQSRNNLSRRRFIQGALASGLLYGSGSLPIFRPNAYGMASPLQNRILIDLFLDGGPDFRHLVAPAFNSNSDSFGANYWANRGRSHNLGALTDVNNANSGVASLQRSEQSRWEDDFYPITVGGTNWANNLVDAGNLNTGVTFGIWKEAGWLISQFRQGNVAMIFNAVGGTNRAHDLSQLMAYQGDVNISLRDTNRSGWGGRLARAAGGRAIACTSSPTPFSFGPVGQPFAPGYNPNRVDNSQLLAVEDAREFGLFEANQEDGYPFDNGDYDDKMARAARNYYAAIRQESIGASYQKFLTHEFNVRSFGEAIRQRLDEVPVPTPIDALMRGVDSINPGPDRRGNPVAARQTLYRNYSFGRQINNAYDLIALNDLATEISGSTIALNPRVLSLVYGGWDSHGEQRRVHPNLVTDPNNPFLSRGIENGLRDIFGGPSAEVDSNQLHSGYSALWDSLSGLNRQNVVFTIYGEFGRQIRDNGGFGTDHGRGNLMFVIGENVRGGIYGDMFPDSEIEKYAEPPNRTPDITPQTEFDHFFAKVCDWVSPNSGDILFPRTAPGFAGEAPIIELDGMFDNLFT